MGMSTVYEHQTNGNMPISRDMVKSKMTTHGSIFREHPWEKRKRRWRGSPVGVRCAGRKRKSWRAILGFDRLDWLVVLMPGVDYCVLYPSRASFSILIPSRGG